jgi:hypothetical protein
MLHYSARTKIHFLRSGCHVVALGIVLGNGVTVALAVGVAVGVGPDCAQYLPPVFS